MAVLRAVPWRYDLPASLVVFLVALPLCVGVAVASGVPAELGLVTGIVGGLLVGALPGSSLQVSGPAAGLTVLVHEAVQEYGAGALGVLVLLTGLLQLAMGALRLGRWFRAMSASVVHGMLAGIGLTLLLGQLYALADRRAPGTGPEKIAGLPALLRDAVTGAADRGALALGVATLLVLVAWKYLPPRLARAVPGPLAAVGLAAAVTALFDLPVARVEVAGLLDVVQLPDRAALGALATTAGVGTVLAFTLIASAETLFSAAAVDRMHHGPRTDYDRELTAQGIGNALCGLLGALPMTAVIVRSATNVQAGARTKASRVLHGGWLLLFTALLPGALGLVPLTALAAVLVHAGAKLVPVRRIAALCREHRGEAAVLAATAVSIIATDLFEGVLIGIGLAVAKSAWQTSHLQIGVEERPAAPGAEEAPLRVAPLRVRLSGNATFLRLPRLLDTLERLPADRPVELDWSGLRHLDHACTVALTTWAAQHRARSTAPLAVDPPLPTVV
ncbi:SulP family inorganic anion transporter [Streptomyces sp. NRRL S-495]|uniref:SulP family inorganic anion transporter n=1 Tax=Streptomyces sp. NRRL S-495 TaxID=1609133 RepID=UPI0005F91A84|nr:SulP family inorganic anion transporter [Streptomyces sp. NRRL S-495]KJY31912.1 sulfate transporter [Streptomyces sp. NRRL S-495]